ncbi:DUF4878 domain-containing protein [Domibacillus indicus]|uniref:DUF4878 domain-containing protein n=1 Tax=Domibacillus indicus TaxID=1437523 RepID=UPI000617C4C2|nr:DUF4878 domain-containing protein [Domibacillus indicus]
MVFIKKKLLIPILVVVVSTVIATPFITNSFAKDISSPEEFVKEYLEIGKDGDYEKFTDLVIDDRFGTDKQELIDGYKQLSNITPALVHYEIKKVKEIKDDKAIVITRLEFEDGSVEQAPVHLVKQNGEWKVKIELKDAKKDPDYKVIKEPVR